mgnify:CR=1 FL=1
MWTNITDEDIENADDEVMNPDEGIGGMPMGMGGDESSEPPQTRDYDPTQPRNSDGTFGSNGGAKRKNKYYRAKKRGTIKLSKKEYAHVVSEINTNLPKAQRGKEYGTLNVGNYQYFFKINEFSDYDFIGKKKNSLGRCATWRFENRKQKRKNGS